MFASKIHERMTPLKHNVDGLKCIHQASTPSCECARNRNRRLIRLLVHRKEYDDLRVTSKYPLIRHRQHPCKIDELCQASQSIGSNQLEAANVTGNGIAEAGGVYTELLTLAK